MATDRTQCKQRVWLRNYDNSIIYLTASLADSLATSGGAATSGGTSVLLYSSFSWGGLRGNTTFSWAGPGTNVTVEIEVELAGVSVIPDPEEYDWAIHDWPVMYDHKDRCDTTRLGSKKWDLSQLLGKLTLPLNSTAVFETDKLNIVGPQSIWGRSLRIYKGRKATCANLHGVGGETTYEARFRSPVGGSLWLRTWAWDVGMAEEEGAGEEGATKGLQTTIFTDLFHTSADDPSSGDHNWAIYITDILDDKEDRPSCNFLSRVYDPMGREECGADGCPMGDLTHAHGPIRVSHTRSRFSKKAYTSTKMVLPDVSGPRKLYLAVMGALHPDHLWACAKLRQIQPNSARAIFSSLGVEGENQAGPDLYFHPYRPHAGPDGLAGAAGGFHVHELPSLPPKHVGDFPCGATKGHYNPYDVDISTSPEAGLGAHNQYELGDLSGKHGQLLGLHDVAATVTDHNLPLFGARSVMDEAW
ncbi:hypothetical protein Pmani_025236 [Petrolisthes manimaculis]|uniref:Uncharacterized protein n=1 Tax=Petrolisthes manimaculis TaxID=1843537 RepID=A0AAE1P8D3_9EUCA|nr:hypothetical protein Pmani_025236 [Petrolisthes manimaculis]